VGSTYNLVVRICPTPAGTVIECSIPDQAALRPLLTQVRDVGRSAVVLVAVLSGGRERDQHGHEQR
jgi:hypothetical protein